MAATGMPLERLVESMMPRAGQNVKTKLVLDAIAKAETLEVSEEELQVAVEQMAAANRLEVKEVQKRLRKNGRMEELRVQMLRDKAAEFVVEHAVPGPPEETSEDGTAAGKKPAAKKASKAAAAKQSEEQEPAAEAAEGDAAE
jgi:trigger factor